MIIVVDNIKLELQPWEETKAFWLRPYKNLTDPSKEWPYNGVGFTKSGSPRFFGEEVKSLIEAWYTFNTSMAFDIEQNKITMDNFFSFFKE